MSKFRLTGDYGTFVITKIVEVDDEDAAFAETGIMTDLMRVGWTFIDSPDGEDWEIEEIES